MIDNPIIWYPNVCSCTILQDRNNPDQLFEFQSKCDLHKDMDDVSARANILSMCIARTVAIESTQE